MLRCLVASWSACVLLGACSTSDRPPAYDGKAGAGASDGGVIIGVDASGPPDPDAGGLCGNLVLQQKYEPLNLYFVLDRSGSMSEVPTGATYDKYAWVRLAVQAVLRSVGHRVSYGAAVFPAFDNLTGCDTGEEIFPTQHGDLIIFVAFGKDGPIFTFLLSLLNRYSTYGGTPAAATLEALTPTLTALPDETVVILATDGAPNCVASCPVEECALNLLGESIGGRVCDDSVNCCEPGTISGGPDYCLGAPPSVRAVEHLASLGIRTYVVGILATGDWDQVLNDMAVAGGTARADSSTAYYPANSATELASALEGIGVSEAIHCDIELEEPAPDPGLVNVYFDGKVVPADPADGWKLIDASHVQVLGTSCDALKSGTVFQVQVVAGCKTIIR